MSVERICGPVPVIPLKRMTQIVASRPAPQTQTRVLLGLLGALIPPAACTPLRSWRGLLTPHGGFTAFPLNNVAPFIYRLDAI